jgi:hypothetical protein
MSSALRLQEHANDAMRPALETPPSSSQARMDQAIARLREGATTFARLSLEDRIVLAQSMQDGYMRVADRAVAAGVWRRVSRGALLWRLRSGRRGPGAWCDSCGRYGSRWPP